MNFYPVKHLDDKVEIKRSVESIVEQYGDGFNMSKNTACVETIMSCIVEPLMKEINYLNCKMCDNETWD